MDIRQNYLNDSDMLLETVYTFPLPWGATLMGMSIEVGENRLQACVIEKKEAQTCYEEATEDGDMPVMVEASAKGLYTANIGNIKPGETVTISVQYAQILHVEQDRIRIGIPAVIAPRYGQAHSKGRLAVHETTRSNMAVSYPLTLRLDISGEMALAKISSTSHRVAVQKTEDGMTVSLEGDASLDRDFILHLHELKGTSTAICAPDGNTATVLASFCPQFPAGEAASLQVKILVDCSGSMAGDSISSARTALHQFLSNLVSEDCISYSRFGNTVTHLSKQMLGCSPWTISEAAAAVFSTEADMGGTEMHEALISVFRDIATPKEATSAPCVLLITDGEVWDVDEIVRECLQSGHRIFAIGVGSAPAESLLREMAEQTGGACEVVSPNDDMSAAIARMMNRLRFGKATGLQVHWNTQPTWQSGLPPVLYSGETLHIFADFEEQPTQPPVLVWMANEERYTASSKKMTMVNATDLGRLGGARKMVEERDSKNRLRIALQYQLVSDQTNLFLVHVREKEGKAEGLPELQQIEQMMAAGWGGYGRASVDSLAFPAVFSRSTEPVKPVMRKAAPAKKAVIAKKAAPMKKAAQTEYHAFPAFLRRLPDNGETRHEETGLAPEKREIYWQTCLMLASIVVRLDAMTPKALNSLFRTTPPESLNLSDAFLLDDKEKTWLENMVRETGTSDARRVVVALLVWLAENGGFVPSRHLHQALSDYAKTIPKNEKWAIETYIPARYLSLISLAVKRHCPDSS